MDKMNKIMLVDDNQEYIESLARLLEENGYSVETFVDPWKAIEMSSKKKYDLIVSDYDMPGVNGFRVIETVRNIQEEIKTILLTGYNEEKYELEALENSVDIFLVKEKSLTLILTYIKNLLLQESIIRKKGYTELRSKIENIVLVKERHEVYKDGELVFLTPKEFQVLEYLLENKGKKIPRTEMIENLWSGEISETDFRVIDVHIRKIREKLNIFCIVSIRGFGYKWNE